jgi:flagellar biosynthesis protein FlhA
MRADLLLALGVVLTLALMIVPVPAPLVDVGLTASLTFSLLALLAAAAVRSPVELSAFPALLLVLTLLRLALTVASTRRILLHGAEGPGAAGQVIRSFGEFVVGGNVVVGLVVFLILVVIQFAVITKGAGRVAEVAARFTLDAMPGKQMAIDADVAAGALAEAEARARRAAIAREADFYGAMDGASKFVRGDAVATVVVTGINILGGLAVGVLQQGLPLSQALETYTVLTVGDGLASQVPALLTSTAAGIVITRAAAESDLGRDLATQLVGRPRHLSIAAGILGGFALVPGLPSGPFLVLAGALGAGRWLLGRAVSRGTPEATAAQPAGPSEPAAPKVDPPDMLALEVGFGLVPLVDATQGGEALDRIRRLRATLAIELGFLLPQVRVRDRLDLGPTAYVVSIRGLPVGRGELYPTRVLVMGLGELPAELEGLDTREPAFGVPARWVAQADADRARAMKLTVIDPATVLMTHLGELVRRHAAELLSRQAVQELLDGLRRREPAAVEGVIPTQLSVGTVHRVLQLLLTEQVSIRDLGAILEALADAAGQSKDPVQLVEFARQAVGRAVVAPHLGPTGALRALTLAPPTERWLRGRLGRTEAGAVLALSAEEGAALAGALSRALERLGPRAERPALLCAPDLRPHVRRVLERALPQLGVVSWAEIPAGVEVVPAVTVEVPDAAVPR